MIRESKEPKAVIQRDEDLQKLFVNESATVKLMAYSLKPVLRFLTYAGGGGGAAYGVTFIAKNWPFHLH